jgi:hypothetical protein
LSCEHRNNEARCQVRRAAQSWNAVAITHAIAKNQIVVVQQRQKIRKVGRIVLAVTVDRYDAIVSRVQSVIESFLESGAFAFIFLQPMHHRPGDGGDKSGCVFGTVIDDKNVRDERFRCFDDPGDGWLFIESRDDK